MTKEITTEQEKFHRTFKYCGAKHREFRNKCIGMLPRILEERIYEKKGFDSIGKYAGKLAGLSRAQVGLTLSLHRKFKDKPALKKLLESGKVGLSKLARVASIATNENHEFLAGQAILLSQKALETLVKDVRVAQLAEQCSASPAADFNEQLFQNENGLRQPQNAPKVLRAQNLQQAWEAPSEAVDQQPAQSESRNADPQPTQQEPRMAAPLKLTQLKLSAQNLEKLLGLQEKGIDINQIIGRALAAREEEIAREKAQLSAAAQSEARQAAASNAKPAKSRYVKVAIKQILIKEHGHKCAKPGCQKQATQTHHADRFAMSQVHDPLFMAPMCAEHHAIAHSIDIKYQTKRLL